MATKKEKKKEEKKIGRPKTRAGTLPVVGFAAEVSFIEKLDRAAKKKQLSRSMFMRQTIEKHI